jgi:hypothetical protein
VLHRKLPFGLRKMLGRCLGSEDRRRSELVGGGPAAAAGARAPAIVRLGLINKRLGELLRCTRKSSGACGGEGVDGREVCIGRRQWRNGGARWRMRVRARTGRGRLFIDAGGRLGVLGSTTSPVHARCGQQCAATCGGAAAQWRAAVGTPASGK